MIPYRLLAQSMPHPDAAFSLEPLGLRDQPSFQGRNHAVALALWKACRRIRPDNPASERTSSSPVHPSRLIGLAAQQTPARWGSTGQKATAEQGLDQHHRIC
ncbi:hypothetical protein GCM10010324_21630 [Streptomyces hiroshimensis]|uniref:Uncharacterized protein n=1 Tax=Streptomyces hiroshimensis TaxID=66424 RepID=A0ABQ2Y9V9_9ACTN|nr:hypothetical protein GCM10010324_21630 [Streptomyces hiroshimensis]